jgi:hypothetical protein
VLEAAAKANDETAWYAVLYRNFGWCVHHIDIEEWLPAELPACEWLYCPGCTGLTVLPELPACEWLHCDDCTGLTALPELRVCKKLDCTGCTGLTALPAELPACEWLDYTGCTGLTALRGS